LNAVATEVSRERIKAYANKEVIYSTLVSLKWEIHLKAISVSALSFIVSLMLKIYMRTSKQSAINLKCDHRYMGIVCLVVYEKKLLFFYYCLKSNLIL